MCNRILIKLIVLINVSLLNSCKLEKKQFEEKSSMASFYADPRLLPEHNPNPTKEQLKAEWIIKGQKLTWGSKIYVLPDSSTLDTIYFRDNSNKKWDTIICKLNLANSYVFSSNEAGYGFSIAERKVNIKFDIDKPIKKQFLGQFGGSGILAKYKKQAILNDDCLGFVSSNINHVSLSDIAICLTCNDSSKNVTRPICSFESLGKDAENEIFYKLNREIMHFLYMPLDDEIVIIKYDPETDKKSISIKSFKEIMQKN